MRLPVAAATLSVSAMTDAVPAKSPIHGSVRPKLEREVGSCTSAPASRASWTCRTAMACKASKSQTRELADAAIQPHRRTSSTGMSATAFAARCKGRSRGGGSVGSQQGDPVEHQVEGTRITRGQRECPDGAADLQEDVPYGDLTLPYPPRPTRSGRSRARAPGRTAPAVWRPSAAAEGHRCRAPRRRRRGRASGLPGRAGLVERPGLCRRQQFQGLAEAPACMLAFAAASARSACRAGSAVSNTARSRNAAAAAIPPRACAWPAQCSNSVATSSSGSAAAWAPCQARAIRMACRIGHLRQRRVHLSAGRQTDADR